MSSPVPSSGAKDGTSSRKKNSKKPEYSRFSQQELPAWKPILTPGLVIATFTVIGIVFIPLGLVTLYASEKVVELGYRYDEDCVPQKGRKEAVAYIQSVASNKTCSRILTIQKQMKAPVFVYYQLDNFYQNHRRFVKSRNDHQLRYKSAEGDTTGCDPERVTPADGNNKTQLPIVPCGLIAWSMFNDTYKLSSKNKDLVINKKNIAWSSDKTKKFGSNVYAKNFQAHDLIGGAKLDESIPLSEQEDLIVWMRTAALPTFRKLYGKIEADLEANDEIKLTIQNNYNTYSFGGTKMLVLSTTSWIGGKNDFLGMAYLSVGGIALALAVTFIFLYVIKPRPLGDPSYLSWNRDPSILR
ncbi:hypothetical protein L6164_025373 [Bauhinia variegata]|uniref:Uncharacterized protein n=1 Tax=Bauhinia variegata TaxID=167791 RepID=A0ACB9M0R4_BAUVA|nr:hypothetical protein L6164_025373 [Bauhinia variegata]